MGVGQHYIKAEWAAKHFGEKDITNIHLSEKEKNNIRNYIIKTIKLETIFNENTIDYNFLESIIKNKPVTNLYSSKSIISLDVEKSLDVDEIERHTNKISYLYPRIKEHNKDSLIQTLIPFISLHESRNIGVFHHYNNSLINSIISKQTNDIQYLKKIINYGQLLLDEDFNNQFISDLNSNLENTNEIFNLSKRLFNYLHPKIFNLKVKDYKNYSWVVMNITDNTVGLSDCPIINFSESWHQYSHSNIFTNMKEEYQPIIKNSVFCFLARDLILWGFNNNLNYKSTFNRIIESREGLLDFSHNSYNFLTIYNFLCSFDFYSITSEKQKQDLFNNLIKNFGILKNIYEVNLPNRNKFIKTN